MQYLENGKTKKFKLGENAYLVILNILVYSENFELNDYFFGLYSALA